MKEKVLITVTNDTHSGPESDAIEVINVGTCSKADNIFCVEYDEILEGESRLTNNIIKVYTDDSHIEITKKGPITSHMEFRSGKKTHTYYDTPFGAVNMGIYTHEADINIEQHQICLYIDYSIEVNYEVVSECRVNIIIKKI